VNREKMYQKEIYKKNIRKVVICSGIEQRTRILNTLHKMSIPIYQKTWDSSMLDWPNLIVGKYSICGYRNPKEERYSGYIEVSESEFVGSFVVNRFNIYGEKVSYI